MIPREIAAKLAKIIPRLATEHEGEVVNAVGAISRILVGAGLDWHVLASVRTHNGGADGSGVIHGSHGRGRWISSG